MLHLGGFWGLGVPLGWIQAFHFRRGLQGLWWAPHRGHPVCKCP